MVGAGFGTSGAAQIGGGFATLFIMHITVKLLKQSPFIKTTVTMNSRQQPHAPAPVFSYGLIRRTNFVLASKQRAETGFWPELPVSGTGALLFTIKFYAATNGENSEKICFQ